MQKTLGKFVMLALGLVSLIAFSALAQAPSGKNGLEMIAGDGQTPALFKVLNASQEQSACASTGLADGTAAGTELQYACHPCDFPCCFRVPFAGGCRCRCVC